MRGGLAAGYGAWQELACNKGVLNSVCYIMAMRAQNSDDVFYVTYSKWKIWTYAILILIPACPLLAIIVSFMPALPALVENSEINYLFLRIIVPLLMAVLFFLSLSWEFLKRLKKPMAVLTRDGFRSIHIPKLAHNNSWTPETYIYGRLFIANPDPTQSRTSKIWLGHKAAAMMPLIVAHQKRQEILDAIDRLSPYPVTRTKGVGR